MEEAAQSGKVSLTYESIFDLVVREKSRDELQQLNPEFFTDLVTYLGGKRATLGMLEPDEKEKASRQMQNITRLVKELYERREKKIIGLALARSRAGADIVDTSALLAEEKALFNGLLGQLDSFRDGVLNNLLLAKTPGIKASGAETLAAASRMMTSQPTSAISGSNFSEGEKTMKLVRFLHSVPRFVGSELEVYGPFEQEDIANLPREIAEVLITKGRAEEIAQS